MVTGAEDVSRKIGQRVKALRAHLELTLDQLADSAEVSRRQLVNIEQGEANPSISTLLKLCDALGVSLPMLIENASPEKYNLTKSGDGSQLWSGDKGGLGTLLTNAEGQGVVELWSWKLTPSEKYESEAHRYQTKELIHVHKGKLTVQVSDQIFELCAGDALEFQADQTHTYANYGKTVVSYSLVVIEPK